MLKSKFAVITGWGTGLAVLFLIDDGNVKLDALALNVLDSALAVSVAIFFMLIISTSSAVAYTLKENIATENFISPLQVGHLLLLAIVLLWTGGWLLFDFAPNAYGAMRTATTLGASILSAVVIYTYIIAIVLLKNSNDKKS